MLENLYKRQQVRDSKPAPPFSNDEMRIWSDNARPAGWNRFQTSLLVTEDHSVLVRVVAVGEQFKLDPQKRVEGVGNSKRPSLTALMECSWSGSLSSTSSNAPIGDGSSRLFRVTHPFHPLHVGAGLKMLQISRFDFVVDSAG